MADFLTTEPGTGGEPGANELASADHLRTTYRDTFDKYVNKVSGGCWLWTGTRANFGYGWYRGKRAHRVSYERAVGPIPEGMYVCHACDVPACVNPEHLFLGTPADNMRDRDVKGRVLRGENQPRAKLKEADVREMRRLASLGWRQCELARKFGMSECATHKILTRKSWSHVE